MISERDRKRREDSGGYDKGTRIKSCSPNQRVVIGEREKGGKKKTKALFC